MPASPARSPRTPSSPRSATSSGCRSAAFARSSRPSRPGAAAPASSRSRTSSTARSARTTTCCSSTTWRSAARSSSRSALCLAALPGQRLDDIERVYSHIQALGQAEAFLRRRPWQLLSTYNTAGAGKAIADRGERGAAAVLSPRAAAPVRARGPRRRDRRPAGQPDAVRRPRPRPDAASRRSPSRPTARAGGRRSSSPSATSPGTLLAVLRVFAAHGLNMSKLESRPSRERAWEYVFWVDLDADADDPAIAAALAELAGRHDDASGSSGRTCAPPTSGARTRLRLRPGACAARRGSRSGGPPRPTGRPAAPP